MSKSPENIEDIQKRIELLKADLKNAKEQISLLNSELQQANEGWSGDWEMNLITKEIKWSPGLYQLLGLPETTKPDMILFREKLEPLCLDKLNGAISKTFVSKEDYSFEHFLRQDESTKLSARTDLKPILNDSGQPVRLLGKLTDITSIKTASKELEKLSTIAAHTSNAVAVLTIDAEIDWINSAFTVMTGYRPEEANELSFDKLIVTEDHDRCCADIFRDAFRSTNEVIQEIEVRTKRGGTLWTVLNISPILDYALNPEGYIIIITDISDLKKAQKEIDEKNREITASITYAKRIQDAIMPSDRMLQDTLPNSFVLYKPKDIIAGDFYWMEASKDLIIFAAADCTGHGVPGAMVSVVCHNALNRSVREFANTDPGKILDQARKLVIRTFEKSDEEVKDGMDISLCSLNPNTLELQFSGANNNLYLVRNNELTEIKGDKQPIGKFSLNDPFHTHNLQLEKDDSIYLYTDGFADQFGGPNGKKFKYQALKELLIQNTELPMEAQKTALNDAFESWRGDQEQIDDVCIWGVKI